MEGHIYPPIAYSAKKVLINMLVKYKADITSSSKCNLYSAWCSWQSSHLLLSSNHWHTLFKYIHILDWYEAQLCILVSNGQFITRIYIIVTSRNRISPPRSSKCRPLLWTDYHVALYASKDRDYNIQCMEKDWRQ